MRQNTGNADRWHSTDVESKYLDTQAIFVELLAIS